MNTPEYLEIMNGAIELKTLMEDLYNLEMLEFQADYNYRKLIVAKEKWEKGVYRKSYKRAYKELLKFEFSRAPRWSVDPQYF